MPAEGRQFLGFSLYLKRMWFQIQILKPLSPNLKDPLPWVTLHWKFKGGIKKKEENNQTRISPVENPANNKTNDNIIYTYYESLTGHSIV